MPVHAIIPPDATVAGGVIYAGNTWVVTHNQLSGNTQGKIDKMRENLQELAFDVRVDWEDLPIDDPERLDHPDNAALGLNTYDDPYKRPDDSLIDERAFYYKRNNNLTYLIHRSIYCDIILVMANDPSIGGNDRYSLVLSRTR